jgi:TRAP-type mannitol/chloroaromatic compound transport system substrate-binding protein
MGHDDIGRIGPATYLMMTSGFPGGANSLDMLARCYQGDGLEAMTEVYKDYGVFIGAAYGGAEIFCYSNKPLDTAESVKIMKIRTAGMWAEILESYGAGVVMLPGGELYQAMERGVIDAFELGPPSYNWAQGFHEICEYIGVPGIHSPGSGDTIMVNKQRWEELPADLQALVLDETMALSLDTYQEKQIEDAIAMNNYRAYGTKIFVVSDEFQQDLVKRAKEYVTKYSAEDATFKKLYESQKAFYNMWRGLTNELESSYTIYD